MGHTHQDRRTTELFEAANLLPQSERASFLDKSCEGDFELLERVEKLLQAESMLSDLYSEMRLVPDEPSSTDSGEEDSGDADSSSNERGWWYEDLGAIGKGGMGEIRIVRDPHLRRELAMKILLSRRAGNESATERFVEEAQLTAQLIHPGVVPVHERGRTPESKAYFTMAHVKGEDLHDIYAKTKSGTKGWTETRTLSALLKVCETMAFAHSRGVIHRDLKPANIRIGKFGEVYVMDWGIAKIVGADERPDPESEHERPPVASDRGTATDEDTPGMTKEGQIMGTAAYMSPEQACGSISVLDKRSDVYALGAMIYELLAGAPPYEAEGTYSNGVQIVVARQKAAPGSLQQFASHASPELIAITEKAMADNPEDRYSDMGAMKEDLRAYLENRVVRAYRTGPIVELTKWVRRNRAIASVLALLILTIVASLGGMSAVNAQGWERVLKLADEDLLKGLEERESELWHTGESWATELSVWLKTADALMKTKADHKSTIKALEEELSELPSPDPDSLLSADAMDESRRKSWQLKLSRDLVTKLEALEPRMREIREVRLPFAGTVADKTVHSGAARTLWSDAQAAVMESDLYGDLELTPQLGFLPIGPDPKSGHWEFWHVQSGAQPVRGGGWQADHQARDGNDFRAVAWGDPKDWGLEAFRRTRCRGAVRSRPQGN